MNVNLLITGFLSICTINIIHSCNCCKPRNKNITGNKTNELNKTPGKKTKTTDVKKKTLKVDGKKNLKEEVDKTSLKIKNNEGGRTPEVKDEKTSNKYELKSKLTKKKVNKNNLNISESIIRKKSIVVNHESRPGLEVNKSKNMFSDQKNVLSKKTNEKKSFLSEIMESKEEENSAEGTESKEKENSAETIINDKTPEEEDNETSNNYEQEFETIKEDNKINLNSESQVSSKQINNSSKPLIKTNKNTNVISSEKIREIELKTDARSESKGGEDKTHEEKDGKTNNKHELESETNKENDQNDLNIISSDITSQKTDNGEITSKKTNKNTNVISSEKQKTKEIISSKKKETIESKEDKIKNLDKNIKEEHTNNENRVEDEQIETMINDIIKNHIEKTSNLLINLEENNDKIILKISLKTDVNKEKNNEEYITVTSTESLEKIKNNGINKEKMENNIKFITTIHNTSYNNIFDISSEDHTLSDLLNWLKKYSTRNNKKKNRSSTQYYIKLYINKIVYSFNLTVGTLFSGDYCTNDNLVSNINITKDSKFKFQK